VETKKSGESAPSVCCAPSRNNPNASRHRACDDTFRLRFSDRLSLTKFKTLDGFAILLMIIDIGAGGRGEERGEQKGRIGTKYTDSRMRYEI